MVDLANCVNWIESVATLVTPWMIASTASTVFSLNPLLLGQAKKLSRKQKSRLLSAFLFLLAIGVCLVLFAAWMSRAMRKYMRGESSPNTPSPETDVWKLKGESAAQASAEDSADDSNKEG